MARDSALSNATGPIRLRFSELAIRGSDDTGHPTAWVKGRVDADQDIGFKTYECVLQNYHSDLRRWGIAVITPGAGVYTGPVCTWPECDFEGVGRKPAG